MAHETERWIVRAMSLLRIAQVAPFLGVAATSQWAAYRWPALVIGLYVAYLGWAVALCHAAVRADHVGRGWMRTDVVVGSVVALVVGLACRPGWAGTWLNWTLGPVMGASIVAVVYGRGRERYLLTVALMAAYGLGLHRELGTATGVNAVISSAVAIAAFTVAAALVVGRLRATAARSDRAGAEAITAREEQARLEERVRQYDLLHTNVLATLTIIARGADELTDQLRTRCARDARFLRAVIQSVTDVEPEGFNVALAGMLADQGALGLEVHYSVDELPGHLPPDVVSALIHAVREALNNVVKHSGVNEAWVVAIGGPTGVEITVTDRGVGFDPATVGRGLGLTQAIEGRMTEIGGQVEISSYAGHGTSVKLTWDR